MPWRPAICFLLLTLAANLAHGACAPIRVGYINHERPPYYMGNGSAVADPPGASIDLITEIAASVGCPVALVRLPQLRIRAALAGGELDMAPFETNEGDTASIAFPLDKNGKLERANSVQVVTVVFVRADDAQAAALDTAQFFQHHLMGTIHGAPYVPALRAAGIRVDDGAIDAARNIEKLRLKRIDGFAVALSAPDDMDAFVAARFGSAIVRLPKPLRSANVWLAANPAYYRAHREQVDAMWRWLGSQGSSRFGGLIKKYTKEQ